MEAKNTVMSNLAEPIIKHPNLPMGQAIAIEQAEISFKAGIEEAQNRLCSLEVFEIAKEALSKERLAGIREVVEWSMQNDPNNNFWKSRCWQAQLKEWGIDV